MKKLHRVYDIAKRKTPLFGLNYLHVAILMLCAIVGIAQIFFVYKVNHTDNSTVVTTHPDNNEVGAKSAAGNNTSENNGATNKTAPTKRTSSQDPSLQPQIDASKAEADELKRCIDVLNAYNSTYKSKQNSLYATKYSITQSAMYNTSISRYQQDVIIYNAALTYNSGVNTAYQAYTSGVAGNKCSLPPGTSPPYNSPVSDPNNNYYQEGR